MFWLYFLRSRSEQSFFDLSSGVKTISREIVRFVWVISREGLLSLDKLTECLIQTFKLSKLKWNVIGEPAPRILKLSEKFLHLR